MLSTSWSLPHRTAPLLKATHGFHGYLDSIPSHRYLNGRWINVNQTSSSQIGMAIYLFWLTIIIDLKYYPTALEGLMCLWCVLSIYVVYVWIFYTYSMKANRIFQWTLISVYKLFITLKNSGNCFNFLIILFKPSMDYNNAYWKIWQYQ